LDPAKLRLNIAGMGIANGPAAPAARALHALGNAIRAGRGRKEDRLNRGASEKQKQNFRPMSHKTSNRQR
jgi:hypothetical protein